VGAGDLLREIDRRLLPPLAGGLGRLARSGPARHLRRPRPLTVAALASAAAVAAVGVWTAADQPSQDQGAAVPTRVGVVGGESIPGYVASSRSELAQLVAGGTADRAYALVTFEAYLPPDQLAPTLAGVEVAQVHMRVPLPEGQTEIESIPVVRVPADVLGGMSAIADRKDREAANYESLSAKLTGDGREERRLRAVYASGAQLAATEAAAYRSRCSCVYAAVVRGVPTVLEQVAGRAEVLAVDPAPEVHRLDEAVFVPPLPETTDAVRSPTGPLAVTGPHLTRREQPASPDRTSGPPSSAAATSPDAGRITSSSAPAPSSPSSPSSSSPTGLPSPSDQQHPDPNGSH
jgi:hypothetical protein